MSNSIWKTPDQKPKETGSIIYTFENGEIGYFFHVKGRKFPTSWWGSQLDWDLERPVNMTKWCWLSDLIAQADKAERLQKAVDVAVDTLKRLEKELYFNNAKQTGHIADSVMSIPSIALYKITALEQKSNN